MYGSILYNCWGALIGFTIYFLLSLQNIFVTPFIILIGSLVTGAIVFLATYIVRMLLHFIFFSPEETVIVSEEFVEKDDQHIMVEELPAIDQASINEFQDENAEEVAKAVRTMMHSEQTAS